MKQRLVGLFICPLMVSILMFFSWLSGGLGDSSGNILIGLALFVVVLMLTAITLKLTGVI